MGPANDPDREFVLACQAADPDLAGHAFRELHQRHRERVYRICRRITGNDADAQDASQEAFLSAFRKLGSFRATARFSSWLHRIAVNAGLEVARRPDQARSSSSLDSVQGDSLVDERNPSLEAVASENEVSDIVRQAVEALPQPKRSAVVLRYFGHCSQKEIARRLGISAGTVKSRLFRAHADLSPGLEPLVREHARATPRPDREPRPRREPVLAG